jgi:hypothetical protein
MCNAIRKLAFGVNLTDHDNPEGISSPVGIVPTNALLVRKSRTE